MNPNYHDYMVMIFTLVLSVVFAMNVWDDIYSRILIIGVMFLFIGLYYSVSVVILFGFILFIIGLIVTRYRKITKYTKSLHERS